MTALRPLKTTLAVAAGLAALATSAAGFAQMPPAPMTPAETTGTTQAAPSGQGPAASSADPLVQKRIDDKAAKDEYKARKAEAKGEYKDEMTAAKAVRKAEKHEASVKRRDAMAKPGSPVQAPGTGGE